MSNRTLSFTFQCDAGHDLKVIQFEFDEGLSTPYRGLIKLASKNYSIDRTSMVDKGATLTIYRNGVKERSFHGIVQRFTVGDTGFDYTFYEVVIVPSFARLSLRHNSRIFQDQSVITILETLLKEVGINKYGLALRKAHEDREYCVQYRETDLAFIERLLAEEGIFYYFEHEEGQHTVVFADDTSVVGNIASPVLYHMMSGGVNEEMTVRQFAMNAEISYSEATLQDQSFKSPSFDFLNNSSGRSMEYQNDSYTYYDYPGRYKNQTVGEAFTQTRIEYLRRDALTAVGLSDIPGIISGFLMQLEGHLEDEFNQRWLVTQVTHEGEQPQSLEHQGIDGMTRYSNEFSVIPGNLQWKPTPNPRPTIEGPHVAIVKGPEGEEIYVDEFGRVKVKFPWDRMQTPEPSDESQHTCWIRVADGWAGASFGMVALPRVGQEVIVHFMEGDPDQPIIIGRTYHATNRQPYKLPDHKTITGVRTKTHKGEGYNELYFDDENEKQLVHLHAEKDLDIKVKNVKNERIDYDHLVSIGHDEKMDIANDRVITVDGDQHYRIKSAHKTEVDEDKSLTVHGDLLQAIEGVFSLDVDGNLVLESGQNITLKVGGSYVVVDSSGVYLDGPTVNINTGSNPADLVAPIVPAVLATAAGLGKTFVAHCPKQAEAEEEEQEEPEENEASDSNDNNEAEESAGEENNSATQTPSNPAPPSSSTPSMGGGFWEGRSGTSSGMMDDFGYLPTPSIEGALKDGLSTIALQAISQQTGINPALLTAAGGLTAEALESIKAGKLSIEDFLILH